MSGWWVSLDSVQGLDNPQYRLGDFKKQWKADGDEPKIKNVILEFSVGGNREIRTCRPFDVDDTGSATINEVLQIARPARGQPLTIRAIKGHKKQKDALIGEVQVERAKGRMELELSRNGKPRGVLILSITDGPPLPAAPPTPPEGTFAASIALGASALTGGSTAKAITPAGMAAPAVSSGFADSLFSLLSCIAQICSAEDTTFLRKKEGEAGVLRQPSGLMYRVLKRGQGKRHPTADSICVCNYKGTLVNGKEFDSTYGGKPMQIPPNKVIPGWCEALQLMVEGDKWELYIPSKLAYGDQGVPKASIPGGATLIFELELMKIQLPPKR